MRELIQQQAHSAVASKSFYGVGAAYFVGTSLVSSARSLTDITGNTLNPFVAGVIGGMVYVSKKELQAKQANTEEKTREVKTNYLLSRLRIRESMDVTTGILKGVKDTYVKAYHDIEARDLRILQTQNPVSFITDYGDASVSGYTNKVTRQKILQDNKSISYKALKSANYLESGLKSTIVLTQVGFYNLGFFIGAVVQKSFAITDYKIETNSLPTVATILYGASYVVNAVVVPFCIGMEVCCFIISSALIGLIGFLMGDTTKLETNKETLKIYPRSNSVQQTIINTLSSSAFAQDIVKDLRYVYQNYAKAVESMNKSLKENEGISSFATTTPLKKHDFLRLQMKKLSLDDHSSVINMIDKLNIAGPTVASTITKYTLQCGIAIREHIGKSTNQVLVF